MPQAAAEEHSAGRSPSGLDHCILSSLSSDFRMRGEKLLTALKNSLLTADFKLIKDALRPSNGWISYIFPGVPLAFGLAFLTIIGPNLQLYVLSIIDSNYASSYEQIYQNCIAQYPSLDFWLFNPVNLIYMSVGVFSGLISSRHKNHKKISISVFKSIFFLMTALDLFIDVVFYQFSIGLFFTNLLCNFVGGIMAGVLILMLLAASYYTRSLSLSNNLEKLAFSTVLIGGCLIISIFSFYIFKFIYQPIPVQVKVVTKPPASGYVATNDTKHRFNKVTDKYSAFDFIPQNGVSGRISLQGGANPLGIAWVPSNTIPTIAEVHVFTNCIAPKSLHLGQPTFAFGENAPFRMGLDEGLVSFNSDTMNHVTPLPTAQTTVSAYWLNNVENNISQIKSFRHGESFKITPEHTSRYTVNASFVNDKANTNYMSSRVLKIFANDNIFSLSFKPTGKLQNGINRCKLLNFNGLNNLSENIIVPSDGIGITFVINIKFEKNIVAINQISPNLYIANASGSMSLTDVESRDLQGEYLGKTAMISLSGADSDIEIEGVSSSLKGSDSLSIQGAMAGEMLGDGRVKFSGRADALWKNERRMNMTRWEGLSVEWKLFLLGVSSSLLFAAWRILWPIAFSRRYAQITN